MRRFFEVVASALTLIGLMAVLLTSSALPIVVALLMAKWLGLL